MRKATRLFGVIVSILSLVSVTCVAADQPIKGKFVGTIEYTQISQQPEVFRLVGKAAGMVSHLGKVQAEVIFPEASIPGARLDLGEVTWTGSITTANGDKIFGEYTAVADSFEITLSGDVFYSASLVITGGTGRFAGATGEAVADAVANVFTLGFTVEIRGIISNVGGSSKPKP